MENFLLKNRRPEIPPPSIIALTAALAVEKFMGHIPAQNLDAIVHTSHRRAIPIAEEMIREGLKITGLCANGVCRWNENGIDLERGSDTQVELTPQDAFKLGGDLVVLDQIRGYLDESDAKTVDCKIIIETGSFITNKAKAWLRQKGTKVVPNTFFANIPAHLLKKQADGMLADYIKGMI